MTTLNPNQPPQAQEYAGDEINALVLDPGSSSTRAGFAGEDIPKSVVPTFYGVLESGEKLFGENAIHQPKPGMEIRNPFNAEGIVEDWETAAKLWEYTITSRLTGTRQTSTTSRKRNDNKDDEGDEQMAGVEEVEEQQEKPLSEYPLVMTEPGWNPTKERAKAVEIAMEEWDVPAFFLAKTGQLAAYSQSRATALVVDIGARNTGVTAIYEGMVLRKTIHRTPLAGDWVSNQVRLMFAGMQPQVPLIPYYMVKSKSPVDAGAPSAATYVDFTQPPRESFRKLEEARVLTAFKESVVQAWPGPGRLDSQAGAGGFTNADSLKNQPARPFEMPDGWNQVFGLERYKVVEGLFAPKAAYHDAANPLLEADQSLPNLVNKALTNVDVDIRPHLLNNIVLTGAGSLIDKLPDRLMSDIQAMYPNPKVRVLANSNSAERKYAAWIGGSVLGSLGTFHQMWISKEEYKEHGPHIVEKRCK